MAVTEQPSNRSSILPAFLRDIRVLQIIGQIVFLIVFILIVSVLVSTASSQMRARGLVPSFNFLSLRAGFDISESPESYSGDSSYGDAFRVGMVNTLRVVGIGLVMATVLGVLFGILLLSTNWLIKTISRTYVEILRNTPLLVQLFVWYYIVMFSLPQIDNAITLPSEGVALITLRILIYIIAYIAVRWYTNPMQVDHPRRIAITYGLLAVIITTEIAFWLFHNNPNWPLGYASGDFSNFAFLMYSAISVILIAAIWFRAPLSWRAHLLGLSTGQFIAGLLFYFGIMTDAAWRLELYPAVYISIRGFVFPEFLATARIAEWLAFVGLGVLLAVFLWLWFGRTIEITGKPVPRALYAFLAVVGFAVLGWLLVGAEPAPATVQVVQGDQTVMMPLEDALAGDLLTTQELQQVSTTPLIVQMPEQNRFGRFTAGSEISPEYAALLIALVVYTSAFIAEIVRAGIQAVPYGQIEASRALGLTQAQTLAQVVLPQALRVIIPPLGNQYLNLSKNSSLAIAIAYADTFAVANTIMNQSGQTITGFFIVMIFYLILSLIISAVMNWVNSRFQLVTR